MKVTVVNGHRKAVGKELPVATAALGRWEQPHYAQRTGLHGICHVYMEHVPIWDTSVLTRV